MRAVAAVLVACALVVGLTACRSRRAVTDPRRTVYCEVMPEPPERDNADAPKKIITRVRFRCDEPGASTMELTLRLQKQRSNGTWTNVAKFAFTAKGRDTVPADGKGFRTRELSVRCSEGVFRSFVTGTSRTRGVTKRYEQASPRAFDPCRPGLFAR